MAARSMPTGSLVVIDSTFMSNNADGGQGAAGGDGYGGGYGGEILMIDSSHWSGTGGTGANGSDGGSGGAGGNGNGGAIAFGLGNGTFKVINSTFAANSAIGAIGGPGGAAGAAGLGGSDGVGGGHGADGDSRGGRRSWWAWAGRGRRHRREWPDCSDNHEHDCREFARRELRGRLEQYGHAQPAIWHRRQLRRHLRGEQPEPRRADE